MSDSEPHRESENIVQVHKARDEMEATLLLGYLRENGIEAELRDTPTVPPLDAAEHLARTDKTGGIYVLEHEAPRARDLVSEFLAGRPDAQALEELAAQKPHATKETLHELREALQEERRTFDFLGWLLVVFLAAMAILWTTWPDWLKTPAPTGGFRWLIVILLALAAAFTAGRANRSKR